MSHPQVVILAAGQSSRLYPLTLECPKCLLPFGDQPLLVRTLKQLQQIGLTSIRVVVGHLQDKIKAALKEFENNVEFVYNENYAKDVNSLSLHLGLSTVTGPVLIIEADVILSDKCLPFIKNACEGKESIWFTYGKFLSSQVGGIIKSDAENNIVDMRIVPQFDAHYADYSKNLGMVYIGQKQIDLYKNLLNEAVNGSSSSYYMQHWINHMPNLAAKEINLFPCPAGSFNTLEELKYCQQLIATSL